MRTKPVRDSGSQIGTSILLEQCHTFTNLNFIYAGYYFLEGGWYCFDDPSCAQRLNTPGVNSLTSSRNWLSKRRGKQIV